jgi:hypothetical protein
MTQIETTYGQYEDVPELDEYSVEILRTIEASGGTVMFSHLRARLDWSASNLKYHYRERLERTVYVDVAVVEHRGRDERQFTITDEGANALHLNRERHGDDPLGSNEEIVITRGEWHDLNDRLNELEVVADATARWFDGIYEDKSWADEMAKVRGE